MNILLNIDKRYRWVKYANYNCEHYIGINNGSVKYSDLETAKYACIQDSRCSAISVQNCNPNSIAGLCVENKIGREHVPGFCIYKKGDIRECICIFIYYKCSMFI